MDWLFSAFGHWLKGTIIGAIFQDLQPVMLAFLTVGLLGLAVLLVSLLLDGIFDLFEFGDGPLSLTTISAFISFFGFSGLTASQLGLGPTGASFVALAGGFLAGLAAWFITRSLKGMEAQGHEENSFAGRTAVVTIPIPEDGFGEVAFTKSGDRITTAARAAGSIPSGERVRIETVLSSSSVFVTPVNAEPADAKGEGGVNLK